MQLHVREKLKHATRKVQVTREAYPSIVAFIAVVIGLGLGSLGGCVLVLHVVNRSLQVACFKFYRSCNSPLSHSTQSTERTCEDSAVVVRQYTNCFVVHSTVSARLYTSCFVVHSAIPNDSTQFNRCDCSLQK